MLSAQVVWPRKDIEIHQFSVQDARVDAVKGRN